MVDPPLSRSAPGRSAPRPPQTQSFRLKLRDDPPQGLGRSAPTPRCKLGLYNYPKLSLTVRSCKNKKAVLSQRWPRNAPYTWCPENFRDSLTTPTANIPHIFHGLLFWSTIWMLLQNLKSVDLPVPEIIGGTQKIWAVPGYAHAPFDPKFLMGFYSDWRCKCTRQIWSP